MRAGASRLALSVLLLGLLAGCGVARRAYYASAYMMARVPTENMLPNIQAGDYIAIDRNYYSNRPVQRFDVIAFKLAPENIPPGTSDTTTETLYVKRVIGLGGETLEIKDGKVYVNGRELEEPFATIPLEPRDRFAPLKIPEGELFLLGDNRPNSLDSRFWPRPTLRTQRVIGKVVKIFHDW